MQDYFQKIRRRMQWSAGQAGIFSVAVFLGLVSFGFLAFAGWLYLAQELSPLAASLICGGVALAAALILLCVVGVRKSPDVPALSDAVRAEMGRKREADGEHAAPPLKEAFIAGFDLYMKMRDRRD